MKNILFALLFAPILLFSQKNDWQQEVDYKIKVKLDDQMHTLTGDFVMGYKNNSPIPLSEIKMHLWANAHQTRNSALTRQDVRTGKSKLYFAPDSLRGGFSGLAWMVDGQPVKCVFEKNNPDIATLTLNKPLEPGGRLVVTTPFLLKIPGSFSRLGHIGQSYQITQWYPKPAVFDASGWHAMPYLNMGEFYAEFGSFEVEITLPENYVVGATGICTTKSEWDFVKKNVEATQNLIKKGFDKKDISFPPSATATKTLHFSANRVPDFAFFADKRFHVVADTAVLAGGKKVPTWAYFTNDNAQYWQKGAFFTKRAVEFYSENVGEYAWPQCAAVHSALSAGGGMEYPMITVINSVRSDKSLDQVVAHEVGHNWFALMLGSNERDHAWLDEGLNSYYEDRYMEKYYATGNLDGSLPRFLTGKNGEKMGHLTCNMMSRNGIEQAPESPSDAFSAINYGIASYVKPTEITRWLEKSVGTANLDRAMQAYFREWRFRHPRPEDFREALKTENIAPTDWYFDLLETVETADYSIKKVKKSGEGHELTLKNAGEIAGPITISAFDKKGVLIKTEAVEGFTGTKKTVIGSPAAHRYVIDNERVTLDFDRRHNARRTSGLLPGLVSFKARPLNLIENPDAPSLGILPWVGGNVHDGFMAGAAIYSAILPGRKFEYFLAPGYGFASKNMVGAGDVRYNFRFKNSPLRRIIVGVNGKQFTEVRREFTAANDTTTKYNQFFRKISPYVEFHFKKKLGSSASHFVRYRYLDIRQFYDATQPDASKNVSENSTTGIHELGFFVRNRRGVHPFSGSLKLEAQDYKDVFDRDQSYAKAIFEWKNTISYANKRGVHLRFWGTGFLKNTIGDRNVSGFSGPGTFARGSATLFDRGYSDYKYDEFWLGRNTDGGFSAQQVSLAGGGFHTAIDGSQSNIIGVSNRWVASVSLVADSPVNLPGKLPLKPFFDFGIWQAPKFNDETPIEKAWTFGVLLDFKVASVHFPIVSSDNLKLIEKSSVKDYRNYLGRITWQVRFGRPTVPSVLEGVSF